MSAGSVAAPTIVPLRPPQPGQHKYAVDSDTKIELASVTTNTDIYYTLNGSKPDPFQPLGTGDRVTMKYKKPFTLPAGKVIVKAMAVSKDGVRESNIVSKTFEVEYIEPELPDPGGGDDDGQNFQDDMEVRTKSKAGRSFMKKLLASSKNRHAWEETDTMRETEHRMTDLHINGSHHRKPKTGPRFMNTRLSSPTERGTVGQDTVGRMSDVWASGDMYNGLEKSRPRPDNYTQSMRLQRETDFLKCIYCYAPRPSDPYVRFCGDCGNALPPLPQSRLPPTEPGQIGRCVHCNSMVPFNTYTCVICEAPIPPQNQPQASMRLQDKLICPLCATANPTNFSNCLACEARLPSARPIHTGMSAPPLPSQSGELMTCTKCGRVNNTDARYCDWCGSKPAPFGQSLTCSKCNASNPRYSKFCGTCGVTILPPFRVDPRNTGTTHADVTDTFRESVSAQWLPVSLPMPRPVEIPKDTRATQTVGLYFPSEREIIKKQLAEEEKLAMEKQIRDRKPLLTAISPGRGYWRKQMEHIGTHLKVYAQNNAEFRAEIGEPRMGKILSASVHEDGYELTLTVNFALRGDRDPLTGNKLNLMASEAYMRRSNGIMGSTNSIATEEESLVSERSASRRSTTKGGRKTIKKAKKKKVVKVEEKLSVEDKALLKEIGKNGQGRVNEVTQLIDEGADPSCVNKDGYPALMVAVTNQHANVIPVLVQEGADINKKGPNKGNTALHEAVSLGSKGMEVIETLLGCSANPNKKNDKGETAYDLAVKAGEDRIVKKLAASMGQNALDKLIKPKSAKVDAF